MIINDLWKNLNIKKIYIYKSLKPNYLKKILGFFGNSGKISYIWVYQTTIDKFIEIYGDAMELIAM